LSGFARWTILLVVVAYVGIALVRASALRTSPLDMAWVAMQIVASDVRIGTQRHTSWAAGRGSFVSVTAKTARMKIIGPCPARARGDTRPGTER
jgi:hypothetical protein